MGLECLTHSTEQDIHVPVGGDIRSTSVVVI